MKGKISNTGYRKDSKDKYNDFNIIPSSNISMFNVEHPVLGISNIGEMKIMKPNKNYKFGGSSVTEFPLGKDGIHIKPSHKGLLHKNLGVPKGEKIPASKLKVKSTDSAAVKKRKIFAQNAKKWHKGQGGMFLDYEEFNQGDVTAHSSNIKKSPLGNIGPMDVLNAGVDIAKGIQMLKEQKKQKNQSKQLLKISELADQASSMPVDRPKRKYVRPEDSLLEPNQIAPTYGVGTNYLKRGGKLQDGGFLKSFSGLENAGSIGGTLGSFIGGGKGVPGGGAMIGSAAGTLAGTLIPIPGASQIASLAGGLIGGIFDGKGRKEVERNQKKATSNIQNAAMRETIQDQYQSFMDMGGKLETYWGGGSHTISNNPHIGETVMFSGNSHDEGGIGIGFGKNKAEVEGGEPAINIIDKKGKDSLIVFGNMKIPKYGVSEIGDEKAKGKKFKSYIADLSKQENTNNKKINKALDLMEEGTPITSFDKLRLSTADAIIKGSDMQLKEIARKKTMASIVQNAILETADEQGLDSEELSKGNFKKAKKGAILSYQGGGDIPSSIKKSQINDFLSKEWLLDEPNKRLYKDFFEAGEVGTLPQAKKGKLGDEETYWKNFLIPSLQKGISPQELIDKKYIASGAKDRASEYYLPPANRTSRKYIPYEDDYKPFYNPPKEVTNNPPTPEAPVNGGEFDWTDIVNSTLPFIRPTNQLPLDPNQLMGEYFAIGTNQLEPVQAQLYHPLLEQVSDISLQDQMNANQADFNALQKTTNYNPAVQSVLASEKYAANSRVLGEQFRLNQAQKMGIYNKNREILNDATLKNLAILDQQYTRQSTAKSNTKATAQAALNSIADKIAKNKLENRTLGIYENLYNYRFGPQGYAWNFNPLVKFNTEGNHLPVVDESGKEVTDETIVKNNKWGVRQGSSSRHMEKTPASKKKNHGGVVKAMKNI